jgi:hypothetical protein
MVKHPLDTGEALLRVAAGYAQKALPDSWEQYLPEDWATNKMYAEAINEHYKERYGSLEGAMDALAENPVSVALDVFIIKSIVQSAAKQSAKIANKLNQTANSAKGTVLEGELAQRAANATAVSTEVKAAAEASRVAEAESVILVYDKASRVYVPAGTVGETVAKAGEAAKVGEGTVKVGEGTVIPMAGEVAKASETTYPIMNQAQRAAVEADKAIIQSEMKMAILNGDEVALAALQEKFLALPGEMAEYSKLARDNARMANEAEVIKAVEVAEAAYLKNPTDLNLEKAILAQKEAEILNPIVPVDKTVAGMLSHKYPIMNQAQRQAKLDRDNAKLEEFFKASEMDNAVRAETAALATEAGEAYGLARTAAGDMYPAVRNTGMVTKAADLARIPNITRPWKAAEIADKAAIPYQAIARTVKASEMADQFTNPDIPVIDIPAAPDKGPVLEAGFEYKPHLRPEEKETQTMEVAESIRPGWKLPHQFDREPMVEGNYWSVDFEDEYWNTPSGINEAMGLYGRPIGSRYTGQYQATSNPFVNRKYNPLTGQYN